MYCKKCENKVNDDWKYCPKCQNILNAETKEVDETKIIEKKEKEKKDELIYIIIFLVSTTCLFAFDRLSLLFFLISLITIVTGFIKCPNSKIIKIFFWLFLSFVLLYVLFLIMLMFTCINFISSCT